jgi:cellulose synthase/poly-beta-1,6-N-acetylglucosamine synthase-like glycosyltransferase
VLHGLYDAYSYFFSTSMPSRNERDSIIFAGTMGLLRRSVLESLGGWDEWCITEDAEASLRMLRAGYSGLFLPRSYGQGIMPLTFAALKSQPFRWCFGGMQAAPQALAIAHVGTARRTTTSRSHSGSTTS